MREELNDLHHRNRPDRIPALVERIGAITERLTSTPNRIRRAYQSACESTTHSAGHDGRGVQQAINESLHGDQRSVKHGSSGVNDVPTDGATARLMATSPRPTGTSIGLMGTAAGLVGAAAGLMEPAAGLVGTSVRLMGAMAQLLGDSVRFVQAAGNPYALPKMLSRPRR